MRRAPFLVATAGVLVSTAALAADWTDFQAAFPVSPCNDGWMGCYEDGERVTPDLVEGSDGMLRPPNARLDWFDLSATPSFSPVGSLSEYPGGTALAVAEPEPPVPDVAIALRSPTPPVPKPRTSLPPVAPPPAVAVAEPIDRVTCDNLVALEPAAMLGKLTNEQVGCLEASLAATSVQTEKDKLSRILMSNSYSADDMRTWEEQVKRHLAEISQANPDLCYKYALFLSKKGAGHSWGVIEWSDVALENRTVWSGETYKSRLYALYKLRAFAALELWKGAEEKHAAAPSDETRKEVDDARALTKTYAREWYEYAAEASKDITVPLQICVSAAGTADFCEGS